VLIKTSELIGHVLDWAVAMAEGKKVLSGPPIRVASIHKCLVGEYQVSKPYSPTTDWAIMGPIVERERINLEPFKDINGEQWSADGQWDSPTPLIAAARCYVASKLGDELDIPDQVLKQLTL